MITFPNAKINLGLFIERKRPDGYHDISTIFYPIPLVDAVEIIPAPKTELFLYGNPIDCPPEKNLVVKAYRLMAKEFHLPNAAIHLYKHIPDGAGLGGGSADASFALKMLNEMGKLGMPDEQLAAMASQLGADCAFFVYNRPMYATGIGDKFAPVEVNLSGYWLLLVKPPVSVPTGEAYSRVKPAPSAEPIPQVLQRPVRQWREVLKNDFEPSVFACHPQLAQIKQQMYDAGALYASMSGSGSSLYGIFESDILAESASGKIGGCLNFVMKL